MDIMRYIRPLYCIGDRHGFFPGIQEWENLTHTALWHEYAGTPYLNGDLNLIGKREKGDGYCIYGIPWCGTSGLCTTETIELGGIILLERDEEDHVEELSPLNRYCV